MDKKTHRSQTISSVKWTVLNQVVVQGVTFVLGIALMRLVAPEEFGLVGMVTVFSGFLNVFKDFGLGSSLIQKKIANHLDVNSIFWSTVFMSALLSLTLYSTSGYIANFYNEAKLEKIAMALSPIFLIQGIGATHTVLAKKELDFKKVFFSSAGGVILAGIVALTMAFKGYGLWALVTQHLLSNLFTTIIIWVQVAYTPRIELSIANLKDHFNYSLPLLGSNSINYWSRNADNFFIGKFLGAEPLAFYTRSYSIMMLPVSRISGVISSVMFPSLSIIQNDTERIRRIYYSLTKFIALVSLPVMATLIVGAEGFVKVVLGSSWLSIIPLIRILAFVGGLQSIGTLKYNVFMAKGKTRLIFYLNIVKNLVLIPLFFILSQYDLISLCIGYLIYVVVFQAITNYIVAKVINDTFIAYYQNVGIQLIYFLISSVSGYFLLDYILLDDILILILSPIYVVVFWLTLYLINPAIVKEFLKMMKELLTARQK